MAGAARRPDARRRPEAIGRSRSDGRRRRMAGAQCTFISPR